MRDLERIDFDGAVGEQVDLSELRCDLVAPCVAREQDAPAVVLEQNHETGKVRDRLVQTRGGVRDFVAQAEVP